MQPKKAKSKVYTGVEENDSHETCGVTGVKSIT